MPKKAKWTEWKFDSESDAKRFLNQMHRDTRFTCDRLGEWVSTNAPDSVAVKVGQDKLGLVMQRRDRYHA